MGSSTRPQDTLRESEESYRTIFDYSNDAIFVHDLATGAVIDANRIACEMSGVTREELLTRGIDIIGNGVPPYTAEKALEYIERAAAGEPQRFEWCSTHPHTGEEVWVEVGLQRVTIAGVDRLLALVRDIRERKKSEEALKASEEAYRTIFEHSSEGIWVHDVETGEIIDVNQAGCDFYGYTFDEMLSVEYADLNFEETEYDSAKGAEYMARALAGESPRFEWLGKHKDGSEVWGEVTLRRVTVRGKDRILGTVRDIKERKLAERALKRANEELECRVAERTEKLRTSEEHFRRLIENGNDYLMVVDHTAAIKYIGPSVQRILGYSPDEMMGMRPADIVHPDDVPGVLATLQTIVDHPGETHSAQFRIKHKNGSWLFVENQGRTLSPTSGDEGIVVNGRDVSERHRSEEALREATEAAERANQAKSEFLSRMSHELRTPMNSILGFAQVLEAAGLSERQERSVQHILRAGQHLLQLINEVLEISRIEAGRQNLSLEPVRVGSVLKEALGLARPMATQARVELEYAAQEHEDSYVRADRQRLSQVMLNLISNAIKYNRSGGRVRVSCERAPTPSRLWIRVEDTGRGIPREKQNDLFTPFARLGAESSEVEGTGLGLALSKRLAEAMGGTLALESTGAEGSVFRIDLELTQSPLQEVAENGPTPKRGVVPHAPATLLYVEDNLANLALVETILWERPSWRTIPALQGKLGAELAREHLPDLILLDLHLPDISGEEVLKRLRSEPRTAKIPVVIITADATPATSERLLAAGAAAFLTKPLNVAEFLTTVERQLPSRPAAKETASA